jgi:hypothetical protein
VVVLSDALDRELVKEEISLVEAEVVVFVENTVDTVESDADVVLVLFSPTTVEFGSSAVDVEVVNQSGQDMELEALAVETVEEVQSCQVAYVVVEVDQARPVLWHGALRSQQA